MKILAKPISSPSRTENFPPPLLRFLKSNGGSKSRGRSRSSPLFIRKKSETLITQEPTSPEVTCMGQVRGSVSKNKIKKNKLKKKKRNRCEWIQNALFCRHLDRTNSISKPNKSSKPVWRRWGIIQKRVEIKEDSTKPEEFEDLTEEEIGEDEDEVEAFVTKTPPKNALLLMRCRSEPYRSSSLANRFWGSPDEEEADQEEEGTEALKTESSCRDSAQESRLDTETEMKMGFCQGLESSSASKTTENSTKMEAEISSGRPVVLTRCKSEPARRSEKFQPDMCFWKKRLEFVDISNSTTSF